LTSDHWLLRGVSFVATPRQLCRENFPDPEFLTVI
jgi:hypothetical protein